MTLLPLRWAMELLRCPLLSESVIPRQVSVVRWNVIRTTMHDAAVRTHVGLSNRSSRFENV